METTSTIMPLNGNVSTTKYGNGILEFDVPKVSIQVDCDTMYRGSFNLLSCQDKDIRGYIYANHFRLNVPEQMFCGRNLNIPFEFDSTGMEYGDCVQCEFYIVTNVGDFYMPFEANVCGNLFESELGEIRNLFHFANLARVNWKKAKECFCNPDFLNILVGGGSQYIESYKTLLQYGLETGKIDVAMDRFLVLIHKKQPITFESRKEVYSFSKENLPKSFQIEILRLGWGYTNVEFEVEGSMCQVDTVLTADDFENELSVINIHFDEKQLHMGENRATIKIKGVEKKLCDIVVRVEKNDSHEWHTNMQEDILKIGITRLYLDYRTGRRPLKECFKNAEKLLDKSRGIDAVLPALYEAHLKLLREKNNEAIWLLKNVKRMLQKQEAPIELYGYFLYLLAMSGDESQNQASKLLDEFARDHGDRFAIYWGCMHKDALHTKNPAAVYRRFKQFYENGCTSPILYLETALLLLDNHILVSEITEFEIQVILFMQRYALLTDAFVEHIYKAPFAVKKLCPQILDVFNKYQTKDDKLNAKLMCHLHIKDGCRRDDSAYWLKKGIQSDCRINGLYETYIRTLNFDEKEVLPSEVVHYYAYDSVIDDKQLAYVYSKVIKQEEEIGATYLERIHDFVIDQLGKGKINSSLAYLYRKVLSIEDMNEHLQVQLQKMAFVCELTIDSQLKYRSCIVRQKGIKGQVRYSIKNKKAHIILNTNEYTIFFEDEFGFIREADEGYKVQAFLDYKKMQGLLKGCSNIDFGEQYYLVQRFPIQEVETMADFDEKCRQYMWLLGSNMLEDEAKKRLSADLVYALEEYELYQNIESVLAGIDVKDLAVKDRVEFVNALVRNGDYDRAYDILMQYGFEILSLKTLIGICQYRLKKDCGEFNRSLMKIVYFIFSKGKYTDEIVYYLNLYFDGTVKQMMEIFNAADQMDIPAIEIAQRIMEKMLFAGSSKLGSSRIFQYCCENEGRKDLIRIYLDMKADEYLVLNEPMPDYMWDELDKLVFEQDMDLGTCLAILKHRSENIHALTEAECSMCAKLLAKCLDRDVYMSYFKAFIPIYPVLEIHSENTYVEYYGKNGQEFIIHFLAEQSDGNKVYYSEKMEEIYPGIYQKIFRVFWGERVPYYITMESEGQSQFCEKGDLEQVSNGEENRNGRFHMVNEILMSMEFADYNLANELVSEYEHKKFLTEKMLKIR